MYTTNKGVGFYGLTLFIFWIKFYINEL